MAKKGFEQSVALIKEASRGKQFFILEDFDHTAVENREFAASPEVIQILANNGYKHYGLEINRSGQPAVNNYLKGKISREDFINEMANTNMYLRGNNRARNGEAIANLVDQAHKHGIKIHFMDIMQPEAIIHEYTIGLTKKMTLGELRKQLSDAVAVCNELSKYQESNLTCDNQLDKKQFLLALGLVNDLGGADTDPVQTLSGKIKTMEESRSQADKEVAEYITKIIYGEPIAIIISAGHATYRGAA